jgi:type II secretory pathway pseudopilin PulG
MNRTIYGFAVKHILIALAVIAVVAWVLAKVWGGNAQETRQAKTETLSAEAMQEAGAVAVATVLEQTQSEVALGDLVDQATENIDNAPDPIAARDAALDAACQLQLYRDDPACALRGADTP